MLRTAIPLDALARRAQCREPGEAETEGEADADDHADHGQPGEHDPGHEPRPGDLPLRGAMGRPEQGHERHDHRGGGFGRRRERHRQHAQAWSTGQRQRDAAQQAGDQECVVVPSRDEVDAEEGTGDDQPGRPDGVDAQPSGDDRHRPGDEDDTRHRQQPQEEHGGEQVSHRDGGSESGDLEEQGPVGSRSGRRRGRGGPGRVKGRDVLAVGVQALVQHQPLHGIRVDVPAEEGGAEHQGSEPRKRGPTKPGHGDLRVAQGPPGVEHHPEGGEQHGRGERRPAHRPPRLDARPHRRSVCRERSAEP